MAKVLNRSYFNRPTLTVARSLIGKYLIRSIDGRELSGKIVEVEEEVAMDSLSPGAKAGLTRAAGSGTITKVESLTKGGKLVAYEAGVKNGSKHSEVQVGPNGNKLAHEE